MTKISASKKITAITLLVIFGNGFFYYLYFSFSIAMTRLEAAKRMANLNMENNSLVIKVPVNKLQKDESDEAWYNDKLYDVVKRENTGDAQFVCLLRDEDEQSALDLGKDYFQDNESELQKKGFNLISSRKIPARTDYNCIVNLFESFYAGEKKQMAVTLQNTFHYFLAHADVPSPPPRPILQA